MRGPIRTGGEARILRPLLAAVLALGLAACLQSEWQTSLRADHPLVGRIWDANAGAFVDDSTLFERATGHRHVLLGEKHDNPDHHRLQALVIRELVERGRRPAVVLEMISVDQSDALARFQREHPSDVDGLRAAIHWDAGGWEWELYRPVLAAAIENGLEVFAGNVPVDYVTRLRVHRLGPDPGPGRPELGIPDGVPADVKAALREEIENSHCGFAKGAILPMMVDLQHARDVHLARRTEAVPGDGSVLIAGTAHVRRTLAVARFMQSESLVIAFVEVEAERDSAADYAEGAGFDLLWFTPRVDEIDPCERFRESLEKKFENRSQ